MANNMTVNNAAVALLVTAATLEDFLWAVGASRVSLEIHFAEASRGYWVLRDDADESLRQALYDRHRARIMPRTKTGIIRGEFIPYEKPDGFCGGDLSVRFGPANVAAAARCGNIRLLNWLSEHCRDEIALWEAGIADGRTEPSQWQPNLFRRAIWGAGERAVPTVLWLLDSNTGAGAVPVGRGAWTSAASTGSTSLRLLDILHAAITDETRPGPSLLYSMAISALRLNDDMVLLVLDWIVRHFGAEFLRYRYSEGHFTVFDQLSERIHQARCHEWLIRHGAVHCHRIDIPNTSRCRAGTACGGAWVPTRQISHEIQLKWLRRENGENRAWGKTATA